MNGCQKPTAKFLYRIGAVVALVAWIAASTYCSAEIFFDYFGLGTHHHHEDDADHHHGATATHEESSHSRDSDPNGSHGDACCKSLNAVAQTSASFHLSKFALQQLFTLTPFWLAETVTLFEPETSPSRQAKRSEWVATAEVCLGPAHRSHAPPARS